MSLPRDADVAVVGAGVIGLAVAWRLARAGSRVVVLDPGPGSGASWAAAGMLAPVAEVQHGEEALTRLGLAAAARWPSFAEELEAAASAPVGYRACGTLAVAATSDDDAELESWFRFQLELGLAVRRLRGRECRTLERALAPGVHGGILAPDDHQVDTRALVTALVAAAERAGVQLVRERAVRLDVGPGGVRRVHAQTGSVPVARVVLAAGCRSGSLDGVPPEARPPVRPVKGQILRLRGDADPPLLTHVVRGTVAGRHVYLVPRADGRVVVGATAEERGFDTLVTAGAVHELLHDAYALVPGVAELELVEARAASRPGSPDNAPIVGASPVAGLVVATGHHRNGILLAPLTADAVAAIVLGGEVPAVYAPFSPARFASSAATS